MSKSTDISNKLKAVRVLPMPEPQKALLQEILIRQAAGEPMYFAYKDIALLVGFAGSTLSRAARELENNGFISRRRKGNSYSHLLNWERLQRAITRNFLAFSDAA